MPEDLADQGLLGMLFLAFLILMFTMGYGAGPLVLAVRDRFKGSLDIIVLSDRFVDWLITVSDVWFDWLWRVTEPSPRSRRHGLYLQRKVALRLLAEQNQAIRAEVKFGAMSEDRKWRSLQPCYLCGSPQYEHICHTCSQDLHKYQVERKRG